MFLFLYIHCAVIPSSPVMSPIVIIGISPSRSSHANILGYVDDGHEAAAYPRAMWRTIYDAIFNPQL